MNDPAVKRDWRKLRPLCEIFPPLIIGAFISVALIQSAQWNLLFGVWMCNYGLANLAARKVLPRSIEWVALFYILCGSTCLLLRIDFTNPIPMGIVFGLGEITGGWILHIDQRRGDFIKTKE